MTQQTATAPGAEAALQGTPIYALFAAYQQRLDAAWSYDGNLGASDEPTPGQIKKARELWALSDAAREAFLTGLVPLAAAPALRDALRALIEIAGEAASCLPSGHHDTAAELRARMGVASAALASAEPRGEGEG
jgi:hypothetical protein